MVSYLIPVGTVRSSGSPRITNLFFCSFELISGPVGKYLPKRADGL